MASLEPSTQQPLCVMQRQKSLPERRLLSRKHDPEWKHGKATGHTQRFHVRCRWTPDAPKEFKDEGTAYSDAPHVVGAQGVLPPHVAQNLNKHRRWETVPEYLSQLAEHKETANDKSERFNTQSEERFTVRVPEEVEEAQAQEPVRIFVRRNGLGKPRPSGIVVHPPEQSALPCKLSSPSVLVQEVPAHVSRTLRRTLKVKEALVCRTGPGAHWDCWAPQSQQLDEDYLQIDLGVECLVSALGTRGRYPVTYMWPGDRPQRYQYRAADNQLYRARLQDWEEDTRWLVARHGQEQCETWDKADELEYVRRYQVSVRLSHGGWAELGETLEGNCDFHTERVHDMSKYGGEGGLRARYLRLRPLGGDGFFNRKALRVAVYGRRADEQEEDASTAAAGPERTLTVRGQQRPPARERRLTTRRKQAGSGHNRDRCYRSDNLNFSRNMQKVVFRAECTPGASAESSTQHALDLRLDRNRPYYDGSGAGAWPEEHGCSWEEAEDKGVAVVEEATLWDFLQPKLGDSGADLYSEASSEEEEEEQEDQDWMLVKTSN